MYSEEDLDSAVANGALSASAVDALRAHVAARRRAGVDEEHFRLVTGFNDIFVTIACLLLSSFFYAAQHVAPAVGAGLLVVAAWGLAEFFTRRRRMALPSIVLVAAFGFGLAAVAIALMGRSSGSIAACVVVPLGLLLHWRRFKVPIPVAFGASAVGYGIVLSLLPQLPAERQPTAGRWLEFAIGLVIFGLALIWDSRDRARRTRRSDVAFWLHLLAAPLIVRPVFEALEITTGHADAARLARVLALYVVLAVVSLIIDRRALMASALIYVVSNFAPQSFDRGQSDAGFAITAFTIGSALLLLSAFWQTARAALLRPLPTTIRTRLAAS